MFQSKNKMVLAMPENQWQSALYESKHSFVWRYGADCLELLLPQQGEYILDVGCGTGQLTQEIAARGVIAIGIDKAPTMIEQARKNYPNLRFEVADATRFHFKEPFDAVFSNATLHWINEPERVIASIWQTLKPGGRFVAEFGGKGNIRAITTAIGKALETNAISASFTNPWYFPSIGEYATLLEKQGFSVTHATLFDRLTPLEDGEKGMQNWIEMFADSLLPEMSSNKRISAMQDIENQLRPELYRDGTWFADYKRIRVVATKA
ncbi:MAG: methyltransferase domain-containing protein [Chroococcidiopsidaceae cyanobacterium CP_BM_ER_R8_30]|nr:methyltransferase domain-containing protein [Chroococcidiopsidaceae cyanobacterium CP_BM_ER_R8_30]